MSLWKKITFPRQPIQNVLFVGFGGLILLAVALVLYLGLKTTTQLTKDYHHILIENVMDNMTTEVENLLLPVKTQAQWTSDQVKAGHLDITDYFQVETFLRGVLAATPKVSGAGIIYPDGISRYLVREDGLWVEAREATEAQVDLLFENMKNVTSPIWGKMFWYDELKQTVIDIRTPLYQDGELKGILFVGVTVADLSKSILKTSTDEYLTPFILYGNEHLLAHPLLTTGSTVSSELGLQADWVEGRGILPLPKLKDFQDYKIESLVNGKVSKAGLITPIRNVELNRSRIDGDMYIVATKTLSSFGSVPWITGVYINVTKSDQTAAFNLFQMAGAGVIVLVISVVLSMKVGRKMARPIVRLANAARSVRQGEIDPSAALPRSRLRELDQAALAFNEMVEGLRERDMIREVFGRYVPESVATSLMEESGELAPISTEATILFSDIEGFTKLTEDVGPERIITILNAYFSAVVDILERHGGVVTQFQGDAVLATFNVPIIAPDHAEHALDAALEINEMLCNETFDGVRLKSRIGINTGTVVAGAVGAKGRLNYTVHGDAVNLAARIENLNKEFQTDLLISENTAKLIKNCELESIGKTSIRGRQADVHLFVIKT